MAHRARSSMRGDDPGQSDRKFGLNGTERADNRTETNQENRHRSTPQFDRRDGERKRTSHFQPRSRSEYSNSKKVRRIERNPAVGDTQRISQKWRDRTDLSKGSNRSVRSQGSKRSERQERSERSMRSERSGTSAWCKQRRRRLSRRNQKRISHGRKGYSTFSQRSVCKTAFNQISNFTPQSIQNQNFTAPDESILVNASQNEMEDLASHILCSICDVFDGKTDLKSLNKCISAWLLRFNSTRSLWQFLIGFDAFHISRETDHPETLDDREFEDLSAYDDIIVEGRPNIQLCTTHFSKKKTCDKRCKALHICKFFILNKCEITESFGIPCKFGHDLQTAHNEKVMRRSLVHKFPDPKDLLSQMKYRNSSTVPLICNYYNCQRGCRNTNCQFLHVCKTFIIGQCLSNPCDLAHDLKNYQAQELLKKYWIAPREKDVLNVLKRIENEKMDTSGEAYNIVSRKETKHDADTPDQKSTATQKPNDLDPKEQIILHFGTFKTANSDPNIPQLKKHSVADSTRNTAIASCSKQKHLKGQSGKDVRKTMITYGLKKDTAPKENEHNHENKTRLEFTSVYPQEEVREKDLWVNTMKSSGSSQYQLKDPSKRRTFEDPGVTNLKSPSTTDKKQQQNNYQERRRGIPYDASKHLPTEKKFEKPARKIKKSSTLTDPPSNEESVADPSKMLMMSSDQTRELSDSRRKYDISHGLIKHPSHITDPSKERSIFIDSNKSPAKEQPTKEKTLMSPGLNKDSQKEQSAIGPAENITLPVASNVYLANNDAVVGPTKGRMMSQWSDEGLDKNISLSCAINKQAQKDQPNIRSDKIMMPSCFIKAVEPSRTSKTQSGSHKDSSKQRTVEDPVKKPFKFSDPESGMKNQPSKDSSREIVTSCRLKKNCHKEQTVENPAEETFLSSGSKNVLKKQPIVYPASEKVLSSSASKDPPKEQTVRYPDEKKNMKSGSSKNSGKETVEDPGVKKKKSSVSNKDAKQQPNVDRQRKILTSYDENKDVPQEQSFARKRRMSSVLNEVLPVVDPSQISVLASYPNGDPPGTLLVDLMRKNHTSPDPNKHPPTGTHVTEPIKKAIFSGSTKAPAKQRHASGFGLYKSLGEKESYVIPAKKRMLSNGLNRDPTKIESDADIHKDTSIRLTTPNKFALQEQQIVHADKRSLKSTSYNKDNLKRQQTVGPSKKSNMQADSNKDPLKKQTFGDSAEKTFRSSGSKHSAKKQPCVYPASEKVILSNPSKDPHQNQTVKDPEEKKFTKHGSNKIPTEVKVVDLPGMKKLKSSASIKVAKQQPNVDRLISKDESKDLPKEESVARPTRKRKKSSVLNVAPPDKISVVDPSMSSVLSSHTGDPAEKLFVNLMSKNKPDRQKHSTLGTQVTDQSEKSILRSCSNKAPAKEEHSQVSVKNTTIMCGPDKDSNKTEPHLSPTKETRLSYASDGNLGKVESDVVPTKKIMLPNGWFEGFARMKSELSNLLETKYGNNKVSPRGQTAVGPSKKSKMQSGSKKHPQKEQTIKDPTEKTLRASGDKSVAKRKPFVNPAREMLDQVEGHAEKTLLKSGSIKGIKTTKRMTTYNAKKDPTKEELDVNLPGELPPVKTDLQAEKFVGSKGEPGFVNRDPSDVPLVHDSDIEMMTQTFMSRDTSDASLDVEEDLNATDATDWQWEWMADEGDWTTVEECSHLEEQFRCYLRKQQMKISIKDMLSEINFSTMDGKIFGDSPLVFKRVKPSLAEEDGGWIPIKDCSVLENNFLQYLRAERMEIFIKKRRSEINFSTMRGRILGESPLQFRRVKKEQVNPNKE